MKIYIVLDNYQPSEGDYDPLASGSPDSAWLDKDIAEAVAASRYAHSVSEMEVGTILPEYARAEYEKNKAKKRKIKS